MLNINMDKVADSIKTVADLYIVPRFKNLHAGDIHFKGEDDPVTIADQEAELALSTMLIDLLPGSKVVGEEAFASDSSLSDHFLGDSPVWTIDPVDGTKSFIAGKPFYGVIVALTERNHTLVSWLYDPTSNEFITAQKGAGAYYKGKKLSVLPPVELEKMSGVLGVKILDAFAEKNCKLSKDGKPSIRPMLSACHDYASLSVGEPHFSRQTSQVHFHSWFNTCTPWDCAAGVLIHSEAGGYTAHWNGEAFAPSHHRRGVLSAPDQESWKEVKAWIETACDMPE